MATYLTWEDIISLVIYFVLVLGVGFVATCRAKTETAQGYFLAGRSSNWLVIGTSTFATNIGAHMFVGLAGSAASTGLAVIMFEWHAMFMLLALGWFFLPVYRACGCSTMPEYLKLRFGGKRISLILACVHTLGTILAVISGQMYSGALIIQQIFQWNLYASVGLILLITAVYTILGGLKAVLWTDTMQSGIMIIGSLVVCGLVLGQVGGFEEMRRLYMTAAANYTIEDMAVHGAASNYSCGYPKDNAFHILRSADDGSYPWPGLIFGLTILATNAWCADQICVQRSLSAKSVTQAKGGVLLAAYLKFLPIFMFVIPGMISRILFPNEVACADPDKCVEICGNPSGCTNIAYPLLVLRVLPRGLRGLMLAAFLSALMSSLTSFFNSSSTIFTLSIYKVIRKKAKEAELMIVGRVYVLFLVGVSICWLPILQEVQGTSFWDYAQAIYSHILPSIVMAFLLGIFWKRTTEKGVFWGIVICVIMGMTRLALAWTNKGPLCGSGDPDTRWRILSAIHYLHFAMIMAGVGGTIIAIVSLMTKPRPPEKLRRVTFWTRDDPELQEMTSDSESEDESEIEYNPNPQGGQQTDTEPKRCSKAFFKRFLCGLGTRKKKLTKAEYIERQKKLTDISEKPTMRRMLNVNAVVCVVFAVFIHAFWY